MSEPIVIPWTVITAPAAIIATCLSIYSARKRYWHEKGAPNSVRISLSVCAFSYLAATVLGFLHYLLLAVYASEAAEYEDPKDHPIVRGFYYPFLMFYAVAILLNIYVWIERLRYVYINSDYGYSPCLIRSLKIVYLGVLVLAVTILVIVPFNDGESSNAGIKLGIQISGVIFSLLFVGESFAVSAAFIYKLRAMQSVLVKFQSDEQETMMFVQDLVRLQMKLTVLVVVQVISTFVATVLAGPVLEGSAAMTGITVDAFTGFMCVYCTVKTHDFMYQKACCGCIRCCALCVALPEKLESNSKANVEVTVKSESTVDATAQSGTGDSSQ